MKYDEDYGIETFAVIGDNPDIWEDEDAEFRVLVNISVGGTVSIRGDLYVDNSYKEQENFVSSFNSSGDNVVRCSIPAKKIGKRGIFKVEIKNVIANPPSGGFFMGSPYISGNIGAVRIFQLPKITGGKDLGEQYKPFSFQASLDSDSSRQTKVTAILEGETIYSTTGTNATHNISVNDEVFKKLTSNKQYSITVKAEDSQNSSKNSSTTFTFTKLSDPPILNIEDKDFGKISIKPIIEYSLTKGENVTIREKIEDKEVRSFKATIGENYQFQISDEDWQGFSPNKVITATIEAEDGNGQVTTKTFTFEKIITRIEIKGKAPTQTDDKVTKVLLRPILRSMEGVKTVNIYACNNGLDNEPTWEDISENSLLHNVSFLENDEKTSEEWAFNLKIVIEREEGYDGEIILDALGGAFE